MEKDELTQAFERIFKETVAFDKYFGMELDVKSPGNATYHLPLEPQHFAAPDAVHGAVIAALLESVLGMSALSLAITKGNLSVTVEFKINYLKSVGPGKTLVATGRVKSFGKRLIVSEADIVEKESNELVATGLGTFSQYPADKRESLRAAFKKVPHFSKGGSDEVF